MESMGAVGASEYGSSAQLGTNQTFDPSEVTNAKAGGGGGDWVEWDVTVEVNAALAEGWAGVTFAVFSRTVADELVAQGGRSDEVVFASRYILSVEKFVPTLTL